MPGYCPTYYVRKTNITHDRYNNETGDCFGKYS